MGEIIELALDDLFHPTINTLSVVILSFYSGNDRIVTSGRTFHEDQIKLHIPRFCMFKVEASFLIYFWPLLRA